MSKNVDFCVDLGRYMSKNVDFCVNFGLCMSKNVDFCVDLGRYRSIYGDICRYILKFRFNLIPKMASSILVCYNFQVKQNEIIIIHTLGVSLQINMDMWPLVRNHLAPGSGKNNFRSSFGANIGLKGSNRDRKYHLKNFSSNLGMWPLIWNRSGSEWEKNYFWDSFGP